MTAQLSRERLEKIASWHDKFGAGHNVMLPAEEAEAMARMLLAGMDSKPVAYTDEQELNFVNDMACMWTKGMGINEVPLYRHEPPAPVAVPGHADCCPECGSKSLTWDVTVAKTSDVVQGRLRTSDVTGMFFLGCDECSETVSNVRMENIAVFLNACRAAMLKAGPVSAATLPDGWKLVPVEPTEEMMLHNSGCQHHAWDDAECTLRQTRRLVWSHMIAAAPAAPEQEV